MDTTDHNVYQSETSCFEDVCPRHGARMNRHHGCPKCVMEEVRRHESRIHAPLELEQDAPAELKHHAPVELEHDVAIPADPLGNISPLNIEIV